MKKNENKLRNELVYKNTSFLSHSLGKDGERDISSLFYQL
jgi:hypothetical protein